MGAKTSLQYYTANTRHEDLCATIVKALKDSGGSSSDYQNVVIELQSLQAVLAHLEALQPSTTNINHVNAIRGMALACKLPLQDFLSKIRRYESSLGPFAKHSIQAASRKARWAVFVDGEVKKLRGMVTAKVVSINLLLALHTSYVFMARRGECD